MYAIRKICLVLVAFGASQVAAKAAKGSEPEDLLTQAHILNNEFKAHMEAVMQSAATEIEKVGIEFTNLANSVVDQSEAEIERDYQKIMEEIVQIRVIAHTAEVSAAPCTEEREVLIPKLVTDVMNEIKVCLEDKTKKTRDIMNKASGNAQIHYYTVNGYGFRLAQCDILTEGTDECITAVVDDLNVQMVELPAKIVKEVETAYYAVHDEMERAARCATGRVGLFESRARPIVAEIEGCVTTLIANA